MIDKQNNCISNCFLYNIMEQCSRQCIRRTFYAVIISVLPVVICLFLIGLARLILYRLEIVYNRRQKISNRRSSLVTSQSGRLALSYTPVSNAELQRIIQGEYQSQQSNASPSYSHNTSTIRKAPRFIKSILPRREPATSSSSSILANLVMRCDSIDAVPLTTVLAPDEIPLQPTFSIINENDTRRSSVVTITRESIETTTLAAINTNNNANYYSDMNNITKSERVTNGPTICATKTMTTTTVVVEEFLGRHSVGSVPRVLTLLDSVSENDHDKISEINKDDVEE
jgi:hypothetical protein